MDEDNEVQSDVQPQPQPLSPRSKEWIPYTPGGTAMLELAGESEATAWRNLMMHAKRHNFSSDGRSSLELRGYSVRQRNNGS